MRSRQGQNLKANKIFYIFILTFVLLYLGYFNLFLKFQSRNPKVPIALHKSYFLDADEIVGIDLIINSSSCKIPDFHPWSNSILEYFAVKSKPVEECRKKFYHWTYTNGSVLVVNITAVEEDGFTFDSISCCYIEISRGTQPDNAYDKFADELQNYAPCQQIIQFETVLERQFYTIECRRKILIFGMDLLYRGFHAFASQETSRSLTKSKIDHWKTKMKSENELPPNILILGIDSTSRLNFRRHMHSTRRVLEDIGAVEMLGYTKVGDNTFPNMCALLIGRSKEEIYRTCLPSWSAKLDDCPLLFHRLDEANYLTGFIEDSPFSTGFHHKKTGFVRQPADFYFRPFMISVHDFEFKSRLLRIRNYYEGCVSYRTNDEAMTDYAEAVMDTAFNCSSPAFLISWSSARSHDDVTGIQLSDETYSKFLLRLKDKGYLENTVILFTSDHGYRYGLSRESLIGWYEDKLPVMWIYLPPKILKRFPQWYNTLKLNSRRLSSTFTTYWTLNLILDTFTNTTIDNGHMMDSFLGSELAVNSTCNNLKIPDNYCPCQYPETVSPTDQLIVEAANLAIKFLNGIIMQDEGCSSLSVGNITAGAKMQFSGTSDISYVVSFTSEPGKFLFESEINYNPSTKMFNENPSVHRASKMNLQDVKCLKNPDVELYCYCKR